MPEKWPAHYPALRRSPAGRQIWNTNLMQFMQWLTVSHARAYRLQHFQLSYQIVVQVPRQVPEQLCTLASVRSLLYFLPDAPSTMRARHGAMSCWGVSAMLCCKLLLPQVHGEQSLKVCLHAVIWQFVLQLHHVPQFLPDAEHLSAFSLAEHDMFLWTEGSYAAYRYHYTHRRTCGRVLNQFRT